MENEASLITKFDNIFIMLLYSLMTQDLNRVKHFLSEELFQKYSVELQSLIDKNECQMYDELNVKSTKILRKETLEDKIVIEVEIISRYMDYVVDKNSFKVKRGVNDRRVEKRNILIFEKKNNPLNNVSVQTCEFCGANLDIHLTGVCSYCGQVNSREDKDYILVSVKNI